MSRKGNKPKVPPVKTKQQAKQPLPAQPSKHSQQHFSVSAYQGPFPSPDVLERFNEAVPGLAEKNC